MKKEIFSIKEMMDFIANISSPYASFGEMWEKESWGKIPQLEKYNFDWKKMLPKFIYDEGLTPMYGVYMYEPDKKLYYINEDDVIEVYPAKIMFPNNEGRYVDFEGQIIDDEKIFDYLPSDVCGEADDFSCYVFFVTGDTNTDEIKSKYPIGSKVRLSEMSGEPQMEKGLEGTIVCIDDIGQIHVKWDNGSTLALNINVDIFEKI